LRIRLKRDDGVAEASYILVVSVSQHPNHAFLPANLVFVLKFRLVSVVFEEPEVYRQLIGEFWRCNATDACGPVIPMELRYSSVGVATCIRGEIESAIREKSKTQKSHARVYVEGIGIEEVEDAEVAGNED
jgi:hypothetical protein